MRSQRSAERVGKGDCTGRWEREAWKAHLRSAEDCCRGDRGLADGGTRQPSDGERGEAVGAGSEL